MKRREFALTLALLGAAAGPAYAQPKEPKEPVDGEAYVSLDRRAATEAPPGKIEVIEFFWYNCPHCNAFEPRLAAWIKTLPKDVHFRRVPVAFKPEFVAQQKLYYALEALGKVEALHAKVFYAIHVEKQRLEAPEAMANWLAKNGVDPAQFTALFNSFAINTKAQRASRAMQEYRVEGVPALGIAGHYYTDGTMTGTMDRALQVADYLIGKARSSH